MTLTATPTTNFTARLDLPAVTPGTWMHVCRVHSGRRELVMGLNGIAPTSGVWDDPEVPLGVPVFYEVDIDGQTAYISNTITVPGPPITGMNNAPGAIITDPLRGRTVPVVVLTETAKISRKTRNSAIDIEGQTARVILTHSEGAPTRQPRLLTETSEQAANLDEILAPGRPILLRTSCPTIPDRWLHPYGDRETDLFTDATSQVRVHQLGDTDELQANPWPDHLATSDTLGDLNQLLPTTLAAIPARWPGTLGDLAGTDIKGLMR